MSIHRRLENALRRYQETRAPDNAAINSQLIEETLNEGLGALQELHDIIVDGFSTIIPSEILDRAHEVTRITMSVDSLPQVVECLERLSESVVMFYSKFLCQPDVGLVAPPLVMPDDTDEDLRVITYPTQTANESQSQVLLSYGLMQEGIGSFVARIRVQLMQLHNYCLMAQSMTDMSANASITSKCLRLHLNMRTMEQSTTKDSQKRHMVYNYLLNDCLMHGYCRKRNMTGFENTDKQPVMILRQVRTSTGFNTGYFEEFKTLHAYVSEALTGTAAHPAIAGTIAGDELIYLPKMVAMLSICSDPRLPDHDPDPYLYAFMNGTYHIKSLMFRAYGSDEAVTIARTEMSNCTDDDCQYFESVARNLNENMDRISDDELEAKLRNKQRAPCMFINKMFCEDDLTMPLDELESKCAPIKHILEFQGFDSKVRNWIWTLFGRALFLLPDVDDHWETALYIMGRAGTGKSTLLEMLLQCIPKGGVRSLPSRFEQVFGWESLYGKRLVIAAEFPENVPTKMLQSALSGELMQISKKGIVADHQHWVTQFIFAANNFWNKNNENNELTRRLAIIEFLKFVDLQDPNLKGSMRDMLPTIIVFLTRMYSWYAAEYGHLSFAEAASRTTPYFASKALERFVDSNPIARFLMNPSQFTHSHAPKYYIEWTAVQKFAAEFASKTNLRNQLCIEMKPDKYMTVLHALGLSIFVGKKVDYNTGGALVDGTWLLGCAHNTEVTKLQAVLAAGNS